MRGPKGRRSRPEGLRVGEGFLGRGQRAPSYQLGVWGEASENFEFGAFWDLKIASEQCKMMIFVNWPLIVNHAHINVAMKL